MKTLNLCYKTQFLGRNTCQFTKSPYLCNVFFIVLDSETVAQMAESVDALVSNTSGVTSIPVRPRVWVLSKDLNI